MRFDDLTRRQAIRVIDGVSFPIFIRNGDYYLSSLMVFEDGLIDCWQTLDLPLFEEALINGLVCCTIPRGEMVSVHPFGEFEVLQADWNMGEDALLAYVQELIARMNPEKRNLYDMHGSASEQRGGSGPFFEKQTRRGSKSWLPGEDDWFDERSLGKTFWTYQHILDGDKAGNIEIAEVSIFDNDSITVAGARGSRLISFEGFKQEAKSGLFDFPNEGSRLVIKGLGSFVCGEAWSKGYSSERLIAKLEEERAKLT